MGLLVAALVFLVTCNVTNEGNTIYETAIKIRSITIMWLMEFKALLDSPTPHKVTEDEIGFYLITRTNSKTPIKINEANANLVDSQKNLTFVVHGWLDNAPWFTEISKEYIKKDDCSVILVFWLVPASYPYETSFMAIKEVGNVIGRFISLLVLNHKVPLHNIHLVGHSLGSHVCGSAGKQVTLLTGGKVARITGLDPIVPLLHKNRVLPHKLEIGDASLTVFIHTDNRDEDLPKRYGDVDFYVNGGTQLQPGCPFLPLNIPFDVDEIGRLIACSHVRSYQYFIESINHHDWYAINCSSWKDYHNSKCNQNEKVKFGENYDGARFGIYFLKTNSKKPFFKP